MKILTFHQCIPSLSLTGFTTEEQPQAICSFGSKNMKIYPFGSKNTESVKLGKKIMRRYLFGDKFW